MTGMLALVMPATATTLVVLTATASLPALLGGSPEPRAQASQTTTGAETLLIVRSAIGAWSVNGSPLSEATLGERLRRQRLRLAQAGPQGPAVRVHFLPSPGLGSGEVSRNLAWLQRQSGSPVQLQLAGGG
ncbi:hypothetical protein [Vulcanococcus limneticus]|uniref:hypothetical protein n=1 Tax=Vulcanococcus limneticus TaxID=2170428 RepID=UPI00398C13C3